MKKLTDLLPQLVRNAHVGETASPQRDWMTVLCIATLLLLLSCGWNFWTFTRLERGESLNSTPPPTVEPISTKPIQDTEAFFGTQAEQENHYQTDYHFVDPSH